MTDATDNTSLLQWLRQLPSSAGKWDEGQPADPATLDNVERELVVRFPDDYRTLVLASDGGGLRGPNDALQLEPIDEVVDRNSEDRYQSALPKMIVIADNGGGGVYFYDPVGRLGRGAWSFFWVNLGDLSIERARFAGASLTNALYCIADGVSFFEEPRAKPN